MQDYIEVIIYTIVFALFAATVLSILSNKINSKFDKIYFNEWVNSLDHHEVIEEDDSDNLIFM